MPQTLVLVLRHAHAAKGLPGQEDHSRELDERGHREGAAVRREMEARGYGAERVLCSTSARTRQTWDLVAPAMPGVEPIFTDRLFSGGASEYLELVRQQDGAKSVMLIGHNPMAAELAAMLASQGEPEAMRRLASGFPPASLAVVAFDAPLREIGQGTGFLRALVDPKAL